jgi:hypothetical protein
VTSLFPVRSEGLRDQLPRVDAKKPSTGTHLQEAISGGGPRECEGLSNAQEELVRLSKEVKRIKMTAKKFPTLTKKGKATGRWETEVEIEVPDGIIAQPTRECGGNVHDYGVVMSHV